MVEAQHFAVFVAAVPLPPPSQPAYGEGDDQQQDQRFGVQAEAIVLSDLEEVAHGDDVGDRRPKEGQQEGAVPRTSATAPAAQLDRSTDQRDDIEHNGQPPGSRGPLPVLLSHVREARNGVSAGHDTIEEPVVQPVVLGDVRTVLAQSEEVAGRSKEQLRRGGHAPGVGVGTRTERPHRIVEVRLGHLRVEEVVVVDPGRSVSEGLHLVVEHRNASRGRRRHHSCIVGNRRLRGDQGER